ncbi:MAG: hypothetical protein RIE08_14280 [Acidimicrobiales bacterium]
MQGSPERPSARYWEEVYSDGGEGTDLAGTRLEQGLPEVIGDVAGTRVLDLGCGEGHLAV